MAGRRGRYGILEIGHRELKGFGEDIVGNRGDGEDFQQSANGTLGRRRITFLLI